jgi:hypothetical protein
MSSEGENKRSRSQDSLPASVPSDLGCVPTCSFMALDPRTQERALGAKFRGARQALA